MRDMDPIAAPVAVSTEPPLRSIRVDPDATPLLL
jgi:hypothetical protein